MTVCDRGGGVKMVKNSVTYFMDGPYCDKHEELGTGIRTCTVFYVL